METERALEKGVFASNGTLVEKAVKIIELLGAKAATPAEARDILEMPARA